MHAYECALKCNKLGLHVYLCSGTSLYRSRISRFYIEANILSVRSTPSLIPISVPDKSFMMTD
jgi:hypothetical protein